MFSKILVPIDGSTESESVLPYVRDIAPRFNSEVSLLGIGIGNKQRRINKLLEDRISETAESFQNDNIRTTPVILYGKPADAILDYAKEKGMGLIIMATHGRGGISRWWMGSVAEKVLSQSTTPVLLINSKNSLENEPISKAACLNILVPLDSSDLGEAALPYAEELALKTGASITLLHCITQPSAIETTALGNDLADMIAVLQEAGEEYLKTISARLTEKGINTVYEVTIGNPANIIVSYADEKMVSLVTMSTHGRSGIARWVFGSVTEKVLHGSGLPLLLVRSSSMQPENQAD